MVPFEVTNECSHSVRPACNPVPMPKFIDNKARLDLPCPQCGKRTAFRLGDLRRSTSSCRHCGLAYPASNLDASLNDMERGLRQFGRVFQ